MPILSAKDIYFEIYSLLWTKTEKQKKIYRFYIPDTILFIDDIPVEWIFTSKKDGTIKKKNLSKLKNNEIITSFMKQEQQITAYYMYLSDENINVHYNTSEEKEIEENLNLIQEFRNRLGINFNEEKDETSHRLLFELIEKKDFIDFINKTIKRYGILQLFKETNDIYNCMYRIMWSPQFSICDFRKSRQPILSSNINIYEKGITFETHKFNINSGNLKL